MFNIIVYYSSNRKVSCTRLVSFTLYSDFCVFEPLNPEFIFFVNARKLSPASKAMNQNFPVVFPYNFSANFSLLTGNARLFIRKRTRLYSFVIKETKQERLYSYAITAVDGTLPTCWLLIFSQQSSME